MKDIVKAIIAWGIIILFAALAETVTVNACEGLSIAQQEARGIRVITEVEPQISDEAFDLLCRCVQAEASNDEMGHRLVASVILNRVDSPTFPSTIEEVIQAPNQFVWANWSSLEVQNSVLKELRERTNEEILYFRAGRYHSFGTPVLSHGNNYFSK